MLKILKSLAYSGVTLALAAFALMTWVAPDHVVVAPAVEALMPLSDSPLLLLKVASTALAGYLLVLGMLLRRMNSGSDLPPHMKK